jgi:Zn finger protein HypA/HybF involved in hydrogenase expression
VNATLALWCDRCNRPFRADHIMGVCGRCGADCYVEPRVLTGAEITAAAAAARNAGAWDDAAVHAD